MVRTISYRTFTVGAVIAGFWGCLAAPICAQQCPGDCNNSGSVTINELVVGVEIAMANAPLVYCPALNSNGDNVVTIDELTGAVAAALKNCSDSDGVVPSAVGTVTLVIGTAVLFAGDAGTIDVSMDSGGLDVAGIQIDITFDPLTPISVGPGGPPDCAINPATGKSLFRSFPHPNTARFLVLSLSDVNVIPDGVLFTCNVEVSLAAPPAVYPLTGSNEGASDPDGNALPTVSTDGAVIVVLAPPVPTPTSTPTPSMHPPITPTATACPPSPSSFCKTAAKSSLSLRDDRLTWRWLNGTTSLGEFGYPVAGTTSYTLCVYGSLNGVASLAMQARVVGSSMCDGNFCWRPTGLRGFKYHDSDGSFGGITSIRLRAGSGDSTILIKGKGPYLQLPLPPDPNNLIYQDPTVTVQLRNSEGSCWGADYPGPAQRVDGTQFTDRF